MNNSNYGFRYRDWQEHFIDQVLVKALKNDAHDKVVMADVAPGSGKTLAALAAVNELYVNRLANSVIALTPRKNLATQYEEDCVKFSRIIPDWQIGMVIRRDNKGPLMKDVHQFGYATTYNSLNSNRRKHIRHAERFNRTILICDEAQLLGSTLGADSDMTSTESVRELAELCSLVIMLSGTPYRADGKRLLFANYSPPDANNVIHLEADVQITYMQGVADGYLRPCEFHLHDGEAEWRGLTTTETLTLSESSTGIQKIIGQEGYWKPLVDKTCDKVRDLKRDISEEMRGLVSATNQQHAREIVEYIEQQHSDLSVAIAISDDGSEAQTVLAEFRAGQYDVLVTVLMAYVGFDHKPIAALCCLLSYRTEAVLRQLFARALRMMPNVDKRLQTGWFFVPNDPFMYEIVDKMRRESRHGLEEFEKRNSDTSRRQQPDRQTEIGEAENGRVTTVIARGHNPIGDLDEHMFPRIDAIREELSMADPHTKLWAFMEMVRKQESEWSETQNMPFQDTMTRERVKRKKLHEFVNNLTSLREPGWARYSSIRRSRAVKKSWGDVKSLAGVMKDVDDMNETEIEKCVDAVLRLLEP